MDLQTLSCPRCTGPIDPSDLACPACGLFTHLAELQSISRQAMAIETTDPVGAVQLWDKSIALLPDGSPEQAQVKQRIELLNTGELDEEVQRNDTLPLAVAKTVGSMIVSIVAYRLVFQMPWSVTTGFVILILVHELGHVAALWWYGLRASPPIFIPFMGAVINLRQNPPDAKVEAVVGIGGPIAGTLGALICFAMAWQAGRHDLYAPALMEVAYLGFMLNLFNLLPVPPLDGGRITAAISPWIWMLGVVGLIALIGHDFVRYGHPNMILILVILFAMPRIIGTLQNRHKMGAYYDISRLASRSIAVLYLTLAIVLVFMYAITKYDMRAMHLL